MMRIASVVVVFSALAHVGYGSAENTENCTNDKAHLAASDTLLGNGQGMTTANIVCAAGTGFTDSGGPNGGTTTDAASANDAAAVAKWISECCIACTGVQFNAASDLTVCANNTTCNAGEGATTAGTASVQRVCAACSGDKVNTAAAIAANADAECIDNTICTKNQKATTAGNATTLRVCADCAAGEYQLASLMLASGTPNTSSCQTCTAVSSVACPGADATPQTHYYKCDGADTACTALTECPAGQIEDTAATQAFNGDRTCKASPAPTMAVGIASVMAVVLSLLL